MGSTGDVRTSERVALIELAETTAVGVTLVTRGIGYKYLDVRLMVRSHKPGEDHGEWVYRRGKGLQLLLCDWIQVLPELVRTLREQVRVGEGTGAQAGRTED